MTPGLRHDVTDSRHREIRHQQAERDDVVLLARQLQRELPPGQADLSLA